MEPEPKPPAPTPDPAPSAPVLAVDAGQYARILTELDGLRRSRQEIEEKRVADLEAARQERLREVAEKEGILTALRQQAEDHRNRYESEVKARRDLERRMLDDHKRSVIARGIVGRELAGQDDASKRIVSDQLTMLLDSRFEASLEDGNPVVRDRLTGRPAADVLGELVDGPEYRHFFAPKRRGGSGSTGSATPPPDDVRENARSLGEQLVSRIAKLRDDGKFGSTQSFG